MDEQRRTPETCPYREGAHCGGEGEEAKCNLLGEIAGVNDHPAFHVAREACEACCESYWPSTRDLNPIIASLIYAFSEQVIAAGGVVGCDTETAQELNLWAERSLPAVAPDEDDSIDIGRKSYAHLADVTVDTIASHLPHPIDASDGTTVKPAVNSWAVGVTTSPRRMPTLEQCVESIIHAGWSDPVLFIDGDVDVPKSIAHLNTCRRKPALGAFPNYVLSLAELYMRQPHADAYMMIQDDALLLGTPAMREYLESVLWFDDGPCIASLYCSKKYNQEIAGWHVFPENWVWGAVAFVFSRSAVQKFLSAPRVYDHRALPDDQGLSKIDVVIGQFAVEHDIPVYFASPSLVQHIGTISTIWKVARAVNARHANQFIGDLIANP